MASRKLVVELVGDSRQLDRTFQKSTRNAKKFERTMTSALGGGGIAGAARGGGVWGAAAVAATAGFVKAAQAASNLHEEITRSQVVFGDSAATIKAWSETTAEGFGIAQVEALRAAGNFGQMFSTIGLGKQEAAAMSKRFVQLAADLASFNNQDPTEMLDLLRSGLAGEAEPLRRFGVLLSEARVKQEAYRMGIAKSGATLTEQQKVQARYSLILKDTALAQGDFARTSDGLANQQRILKAKLSETVAELGTKLLPMFVEITEAAIEMADRITEAVNAIDRLAQFGRGGAKALDRIQVWPGGTARPRTGAGGKPWEAIHDRPVSTAIAGRFQAPPAPRPGATMTQRNNWFDAKIARELDRAQDLSLRNQLARLKAIAAEVRARLSVTKDATRRLTLEDQLLDIQRQQQQVMEGQASAAQDIVDKIKAANEALKDRAQAIKSAVLERLQRRQTDILNKRALEDAKEALRIARQIGGPKGIQAAMRGVQDARFDMERTRLENAPATLTKGGQFSYGGVIININGITDPEAVAKKVAEVLQRRTKRTTTQMRGPAAGVT